MHQALEVLSLGSAYLVLGALLQGVELDLTVLGPEVEAPDPLFVADCHFVSFKDVVAVVAAEAGLRPVLGPALRLGVFLPHRTLQQRLNPVTQTHPYPVGRKVSWWGVLPLQDQLALRVLRHALLVLSLQQLVHPLQVRLYLLYSPAAFKSKILLLLYRHLLLLEYFFPGKYILL
jgi:hypothetical protein